MVRAASVSESDGERAFADVLERILREWPYFAAHPEAVWTQPIENDPLGRRNVLALVRGQGPETLVLSGHFDVVDVRNYGPHAEYAFDPEVLERRIIADLEEHARNEAEFRALADLKGGDFMTGRGALDMKAGLAAGLSVLERFSQQSERQGNLLFVAVADEEVSSHGARWAAPRLPEWAEQEGLRLRGVVNLDATGDNGDGSAGQAVYVGTAGKLLVSAFVVGVDTHAGYSLDGVNANFLASELARAFEWNPALTDTSRGIRGTPPTLLKQTDLKTHYDVTTPARAWLCVNMLTHGLDAAEVLSRFRQQAQETLQGSLQLLRERAEALGAQDSAAHGAEALVMTYAELLARVGESTPDLATELQRFEEGLPAHLDYPARSAQITNWLWNRSGLHGPAAVMGFASLHYPYTALESNIAPEAQFLAEVRQALAQAPQRHGVTVTERPVFTGISDMSWFGRTAAADIAVVNANTPLHAAQIHALPAGLPCVNLGPWGRDYHQWLERVHKPYSFGVLPALVWDIAAQVLGFTEEST